MFIGHWWAFLCTCRSKEAGAKHTHRCGRRMGAQGSAIGRPINNVYCCKHCVSICAVLVPPLADPWRPLSDHRGDHCASFRRPRPPLCFLSATCCATTAVLVLCFNFVGKHKHTLWTLVCVQVFMHGLKQKKQKLWSFVSKCPLYGLFVLTKHHLCG